MSEIYDKENHWYGWNGGECPVHPDTIVYYMLRNGTAGKEFTRNINWTRDDCSVDIVAFRIIKLYREPRKAREFWCNEYVNREASDEKLLGRYPTQEMAIQRAAPECTGQVLFREVLEHSDGE